MTTINPLDRSSTEDSANFLKKALSSALFSINGLNQLGKLYEKLDKSEGQSFYDSVLDILNISLKLVHDELLQIPEKGPLVLVANHPLGALEGVILLSIIEKVRKDYKVLLNSMMSFLPEMQKDCFYVNPFGGKEATKENIKGIKQCINWLKEGGSLCTFPAGEVAHLRFPFNTEKESQWHPNIARMIIKTEATVIPVYFHAKNSLGFHISGLVHPFFRTLMLPKQLLNKQNTRIKLKIGSPIPFKNLSKMNDPECLVSYLRSKTLLLRECKTLNPPPAKKIKRPKKIIDAHDQSLIEEELNSLPPSALLVDTDEIQVYHSKRKHIPIIMREIGRLREITFRKIGEGVGKKIDLDRYDNHYYQLFLWHKANKEIMGAYRIVKADEALKKYGYKGLYTASLFRFDKKFFQQLGPAIEMGRSFIREEYQRNVASLFMLWKGIGSFVSRNPESKTLFGPVSISDNYLKISRNIIVQSLLKSANHPLKDLVFPKNPCDINHQLITPLLESKCELGIDEMFSLVSDFEREKSIPVLLKQYLKMGGKVLAANLDPKFNNAIDIMVKVDLAHETKLKSLEKYMGKEEAREFYNYHDVSF